MDVIGISGEFLLHNKPAAVNWIEGQGKSVAFEAVIRGEIVNKVLKTSVFVLGELNMLTNLTVYAVAGSLGGFKLKTRRAQCITMMEATNGKDIHNSVTTLSIEVGTVREGTQFPSISA
ncbi:unnamed protein product [Eruca vesicaria subsp. sativa]|uniref:Dirigent protein n=1 Tax=Eruca vesicaria subsp. sativa TaxID=29727 RepID=A0ABC8LQG5_ERUVS|nr:unnamed protein product [Eruca vesicaria subsp. sativa]